MNVSQPGHHKQPLQERVCRQDLARAYLCQKLPHTIERFQRTLNGYSLDSGSNFPKRLAAQRVLAGVWSIGWLLLRSSRNVSLSDYIPLRLRQAQDLVTDLTH